MTKRVAFLTTIFPMDIQYLYDFFDSLENQTYKKFDIIVVNDGYQSFNHLSSKYGMLNIIELKFSSTIAKNREFGINYVIDNNYDILIFGDSDDYFSKNRVEKSLDILKEYDIIVNDLSLFDSNGVYCEKYISNRILSRSEIDFDFIKDKNIFGLSNTALNVNILNKVSFDEEIVAADWFLYRRLLLENHTALFINETETFYRQYDNNTIGLDVKNDTYPLWWENTNART